MTDFAAARRRVQGCLAVIGLGSVMEVEPGHWTFRIDSTRVIIKLEEQQLPSGDEHRLVSIFAPVALNAKLSRDLYEYVALHGGHHYFGHLDVEPGADGRGSIYMTHTLVADCLDEPEFSTALYAVGGQAEALEDLASRFDGQGGVDVDRELLDSQ